MKCVLALPEVHALANTPEKCRQRHLTMKERGVYFTSKPEDIFYELLCSKFGSDSVRRRVSLKTWSMDFYIETIDTFVQFDGEYWHGLDRPLEVIRESTSPRDKTILRKYEIDREQDEWFKSTGKNLLRVTDKQFARGEIPDDLR